MRARPLVKTSIRVAIVDDEPPARAKLRRLLGEAEDLQVVGEAATGLEAVNLILREKPDLVFLDISMPDIDGFDVARALPAEARPQIVYVTAHDDRALEAFEVHAVDYLLKPVDPDRFFAVLERVRGMMTVSRTRADDSDADSMLASLLASKEYPKRFLLADGDRAMFVTPVEIGHAESARNYVVVHARGERFILRSTLDDFQSRLDPEQFTRMNRSHIVNLDFVDEMLAVGHGEYRVRLRDGTELVWSRRYTPGRGPASESL